MDLARDPELLYWLPHAEAAIEAEAHAQEQRSKHKGGGKGYGRR